MATIQTGAFPHIHSGKSTHKYMFDLPITTYPMAVIAIIFQFIFATAVLGTDFVDGAFIAIQAALVIFTGVFSCILAESLWWKFVGDNRYNDFAGWFRVMATTYPSITGMLYALALPIGTPLYVVFIGGFVAIILGKTIYGGVGKNIFNPALVGRAFVTIAYTGLLGAGVVYTDLAGTNDAIAGASPLAIMQAENWLFTFDQFKEVYGSFWKLFLGFYPSALGEGLTFWIIGAAIFLSFRKTIEWYVPAIYVGLVFLMTWAIALMNGLDTGSGLGTLALYYPLTHVFTGGLLFGAVFMATEPVTTPVTRRGRAIFATYVAIITVLIRVLGKLPEGVLFSILFMNMFTPIIDNALSGQYKGIRIKEIIFWIVTLAIIVGVTIYMGIQLGGSL
jgi:Na+-translocating ferredoxin:NAD+ oxidoreductase subunit D